MYFHLCRARFIANTFIIMLQKAKYLHNTRNKTFIEKCILPKSVNVITLISYSIPDFSPKILTLSKTAKTGIQVTVAGNLTYQGILVFSQGAIIPPGTQTTMMLSLTKVGLHRAQKVSACFNFVFFDIKYPGPLYIHAIIKY